MKRLAAIVGIGLMLVFAALAVPAEAGSPQAASKPTAAGKPTKTPKPTPTPTQTVTPTPTPTATTATPTPTPTTESPTPTPTATTASPTPTNTGACDQPTNTPGGPDPWGGCWPGENNTGVKGCPALERIDGDYWVRNSGERIENKEIHGEVRFDPGVKGVVFYCVKVVAPQSYFPVDTERSSFTNANDILFDRVDVDCGGWSENSAAFLLFGATVRHANTHGCLDAYRWDSETVIEDSYCGNQELIGANFDPHFDCAQTSKAKNVVIRHNTLEGKDTSDVAVWPDMGPIDNVLVDKNLLIGSPGYKIYVSRVEGEPTVTNVTVSNNRFGRDGAWGPCSVDPLAAPNTTWTGNVWNDTGETLPISAC